VARTSVLLLLVSWLGLTSSLWAEAPLNVIPDNADVVVRLKGPEATTGKLAEFAESIEANTGNWCGPGPPNSELTSPTRR
jgi:hypothetical protein